MVSATKSEVPYGVCLHAVNSPDDGGWYVEMTQHPLSGRGRWSPVARNETVTFHVYPTREAALLAARDWVNGNWHPCGIIELND